MRELKAGSSHWVREKHFEKFAWQSRYGAFTVSESQVEKVRKYIEKQKEHHQVKNFSDEYKALLVAHKVPFEEKYLWG